MTDDTTPFVVVGVDGSDYGNQALEWAQEYAEQTGSRLTVVVGWQYPVNPGAGLAYPPDFRPDNEARSVASKAHAALRIGADRAEVQVIEGPAGRLLVQASEGAKALVVGSKGHSALAEVFLGSTSAYCVRRARCSVIVVR